MMRIIGKISLVICISLLFLAYSLRQKEQNMCQPVLNLPVSLKFKYKQYEFQYSHKYEGKYGGTLYVRPRQWTVKASEILSFKVLAKIEKNGETIVSKIITPEDIFAYGSELIFIIPDYQYTKADPKNYKLILSVLEPETSSLYTSSRIEIGNSQYGCGGAEALGANYSLMGGIVFAIFASICLVISSKNTA